MTIARKFLDKVIIVTGGAGGIGSSICHRFAAEGARVAICDLNLEGAKTTASNITAVGGQAIAIHCDITCRNSVDSAITRIESTYGPVDVLVNNAGWDVFNPFLKTSVSDWERLISVNFIGALHMHHAVLPTMVSRSHGRIINIASDAARVGSSGEAVYAACKGALVSLSKTLAREHARHGTTVNVVCPGPTATALFAAYKESAGNPDKLEQAFTRSIPIGRIGAPDDLPGAVLFFASDDAEYITGQVLSVSGGLTMAG